MLFIFFFFFNYLSLTLCTILEPKSSEKFATPTKEYLEATPGFFHLNGPESKTFKEEINTINKKSTNSSDSTAITKSEIPLEACVNTEKKEELTEESKTPPAKNEEKTEKSTSESAAKDKAATDHSATTPTPEAIATPKEQAPIPAEPAKTDTKTPTPEPEKLATTVPSLPKPHESTQNNQSTENK